MGLQVRSCCKLSKKWTYCKKFPIVENRAQAFVTLWACYVLFCLFNVLLDWWLFCDSRNKNLHFRFLVFFFFLISFVDSFFQSFLMAFTRLKQNDRETFQNWDLSVVLTVIRISSSLGQAFSSHSEFFVLVSPSFLQKAPAKLFFEAFICWLCLIRHDFEKNCAPYWTKQRQQVFHAESTMGNDQSQHA